MPKPRRSRVGHKSPRASEPQAPARIDAMCRGIVAGKLATRELGALVRPVGLVEAEFRLLWALAMPAGGEAAVHLGQSGLADELAVSPAQVSGLVERLRSRGLIESSLVGGDRRRQAWRLTKTGEQVIARVLSVVAAIGISPIAPRRRGPSSTFEGGGFCGEDAA
jgi:DNA-binding MarR family transcriptional regulator